MDDFGKRNFYEMLGLERQATTDQIKEAYRTMARLFHPDSNFFDDIVEIELTAEQSDKFKLITAAYHTLVDPDKRALYDETLPPDLRSWEDDDGSSEFGFISVGGKKYYYTQDGDIRVKDPSNSMTWNSFGKVNEVGESEPDEERSTKGWNDSQEDEAEVYEPATELEELEEQQALNSTSSRWGSGANNPIPTAEDLRGNLPRLNPWMLAICAALILLIGLPATLLLVR